MIYKKLNKTIYIYFILLILYIFNFSYIYADDENVKVYAYYAHPISGEIADRGKNSEIGQGMCESVLSPDGIYELYSENLFLTLKFNMASYLKDANFTYGDEKNLDYELIEENLNEDYMEYKIQVPSREDIIKAKFYVIPMGREIEFYISTVKYDISKFESNNALPVINNQSDLSRNSNLYEVRGNYRHGLLLSGSEELNDFLGIKEDIETNEYGSYRKGIRGTKVASNNEVSGAIFKAFINLISAFAFLSVLLAIVMKFSYDCMRIKNDALQDKIDEI